jgi:hypothetical protein
MKTILFLLLCLIPAGLFVLQSRNEDLAVKFLDSLDQSQRAKTQLPFDDLSRQEWHFVPASMWPRTGIQLNELKPDQKELFFNLLRGSLSEAGYSKTRRIIELENVLKEMGGDPVMRDPEKYAIAFYGDPAKDQLWAWTFEGHHISLNFTVFGQKVSMTPRFLGANPATIPQGKRKGERTLDKEEDLGLQLIGSMSAEQQQKAIFQKTAYAEIVTSNATEVSPLRPVGIMAKELNAEQQKVLQDLLHEYLSAMPEDLASARMQKLEKEEFDLIRFGWAGGTVMGEPHYYRIQGRTFLVEFDNTQNGANHIHTVWRDFNGDFGRDLLREHYLRADHHRN